MSVHAWFFGMDLGSAKFTNWVLESTTDLWWPVGASNSVLQAWAHMHKHRRKECLHYDSLKVDFLHFLHCFKWQEGDSIFGGSSLYLILGTGVCPLSSMKWCCREFQKSIDVMASHVRGGPGARRSSTCSATKWFCPHTSCPIYSFSCSPNQWVPLTGGN